jgi:hypothetical protein
MRQLFHRFIGFIKRLLGIRATETTLSPPFVSQPITPTATTTVEGATIPVPTTKAEIAPPIAEPELGLASSEPPQYRKRDYLFTYRERVFYTALLEEVGTEYQIFAKVRLGDIVWLANEPENRKFYNNQIQCKHVDFLLCDKGVQRPLLAIELDDSSHDKYDRRESDEFKERLFAETGLPLLRVMVQQTYPKGEIRQQIRGKLHEHLASALSNLNKDEAI